MLQNKYVKRIPIVIIVVMLIGMFYINMNNNKFFKMNFYEIFTIASILFISIYFVEKKTDTRILNVKIEETLDIIQGELSKINAELFNDSFERRDYTMISRRISNKIALLEHYSKKVNIEEDVKFIKDKTQELDMMICNHLDNVETLRVVLIDINNKQGQIEVRIDNIFKKIY